MSAENIHIAGRYNKYLRNLSQSPWIDKDDVRVKDSVQELIEVGLRKYLKFDKSVFASAGREDVDVRMLGRGRPFAFKIQNPQLLNDYNSKTLKQIQDYVNSKQAGKVSIRDLQIVTKSDVSKFLTDTQDTKQKQYRALCCCTRALTKSDIERLNSIKDLVIDQATPIRVLHRRTLSIRKRTIYQMRVESVKLGDFDCLKEGYLQRVFSLILTTEAGTYIKEFVHGDFSRTRPNLSSLLGGDCDCDLLELDVMEVYSDWPPEIAETELEVSNGASMNIQGTEDRLENSPQALADVYEQALKSMQDAASKPRGDERQELYMRARHLFARALNLVEQLSVFSNNEAVDDIATADLKYLLVPAYLAKILVSAECCSDRLATFTKAKGYAVDFLRLVSQYGLGDATVDNAIRCSDDEFYGDVQANKSSSKTIEDAMRERNEKIAQYRRVKELDDKISELEKRLKESVQHQVDDEFLRDYNLALIRKTTVDILDSLEREIKPAIFFERNRAKNDGPHDVNQIPSSSSVGPKRSGQPITIVKNQIQKQVFGLGYPGHPTVTVDEFITNKIKDGDLAFNKHKEIYTNSLQRYAEQPNLRREQEELSDEERDTKEDLHDDNELQRKRKWDEFKDDNPRGSGNRHNMG